NLQLVAVPGDDDETAAVRAPQPSHVPHLPLDHDAAPLQIDRREATVSHTREYQAVAGIVAPEDGRHSVVVPPDEQIGFPVAVEVPHQYRADRRELSLGGKGPQCEG